MLARDKTNDPLIREELQPVPYTGVAKVGCRQEEDAG